MSSDDERQDWSNREWRRRYYEKERKRHAERYAERLAKRDPEDDKDGYEFHKVYEAVAKGRRYLWIRYNSSKKPEWSTMIRGRKFYNDDDYDLDDYKPDEPVMYFQRLWGGTLYHGTEEYERAKSITDNSRHNLRSGYQFDETKGEWYWSRSTPEPKWMKRPKPIPQNRSG